MNETSNKCFGESKVFEQPTKKLKLVIADGTITPAKLAPNFAFEVVQPVVDRSVGDLQNQISSIQANGIAVSNTFGKDTSISISQKAITDALNRIWRKINDITGETGGIGITITPDSYFTGDSATVTINVSSTQAANQFERVVVYFNGVEKERAEDVIDFTITEEITSTTIIRVDAVILGESYSQERVITKFTKFYIGAGKSWNNIFNGIYIQNIDEDFSGVFPISTNDDDYIFIILGKDFISAFDRADMNGFEIPFVKTTVKRNNEDYIVFRSEYQYKAGTYNIYINR